MFSLRRLAGSLFFMLALSGCRMNEPGESVMMLAPLSPDEGGLGSSYDPLSPVLRDVYDRSISEEVYSDD